jgi:hypothetical protein
MSIPNNAYHQSPSPWERTQSLAAHLPTFITNLIPQPRLHLQRPLDILPTQRNNLTNHQLGHTPRIGKGRIEDGDAAFARILEIDLVGADAKTANAHQVLGMPQDFFREFSFGADANCLDIPNLLNQFLVPQRCFMEFNLS